MNVQLDLIRRTCKVVREPGDKIIARSGYNGSVESPFLYCVKQELIKQGFDVIKKLAWKDGGLCDMKQQWIRTRHFEGKTTPEFALYNGASCIQDAGEEYNRDGEYSLDVLIGDN